MDPLSQPGRPVVLVTGGAGYIGSHTCKQLHASGYTPVVLDNLATGWRDFVRWGVLEEGDVCDKPFLDAIMKKYRPHAVFHFAALSVVEESMRDPARYYRVNTIGSLNLLQSMHEHGVRYFILSSSAAVYGEPRAIPIPESHPLNPINPYGQSKLFIEQMTHHIARVGGIHYVILRYFNAAGADLQGEPGEDHRPETHLIPLVLHTAQGTRGPLHVFGTDYDTADGTCVRDYIHVNDLAEIHCRALRHLEHGGASDTFNVGTGMGHSIREIIEVVEHVTQRPLAVFHDARRSGDPARLVADTRKVATILNWNPQYSDLRTVVETAWSWANHHDQVARKDKEFPPSWK
ncbi:MAG: UDP-glucose 4-epimerase GalE [Magnetococcales bacterium]|nr:UDP-glucose 4-epimerase GalE [Magnetococcales bacterium]MBF0149661.1 UDP-glucose 4-epimerase GalE [Magnetococcales bacterium]MBF0631804.1 UDP-glucose 4-epimerase GalE [Magnetococcales bacterium]